jgi:outer membrane murein-binding lipoprotein Lpp
VAASGRAVERLGLSAYSRVCLAAVGLGLLVLVYLVVDAQATQVSFQLGQLRARNAQLQAEQDQLRYQSAQAQTPSQVAQEAAALGMRQGASTTYVPYHPVRVDLGAPIGPSRPRLVPLWRRLWDRIFGSGG